MAKSGISAEHFDPSVRPQDDLYQHVNGGWLETATIADDRPLTGSFTELRDAAEAAVRTIIEDAAKAAERTGIEAKIGDLYTSFMDAEAIERAGTEPLAGTLAEIFRTASVDDVVALMGRLDRTGNDGLFGAMVTNDAGNPQRCLLHLFQGGLGLPDESYYREEKSAAIRTAYEGHIERMLTLAGVADAAAAAVRVLELEMAIAACHWDNVTLRDPQKTYTLLSREDAIAALPALRIWLDALGVPAAASAELIFYTADFFTMIGALLADKDLRSWQEWLAMRYISSNAAYLSAAIVQANFDFYGTTLSGTPVNKGRWKRGVALVEGSLGEAVGQVYVAKHFPQEHKARMETLVANLVEAYRQSIAGLGWMSQETIAAALAKLEQFGRKIGYPAAWRDYSTLRISSDDLLGNVARSHEFEFNRQLAKIGAPIDRDEWLMTPQTVNAYYNPRMNEIVFPAAILQPPFFDPEADDAANYGGIGAVIGHEIGHGFDDQGSAFDGSGALRNWWTDADRQAFEKLTAALVAQYEVLSPLAAPGHFVNGKLTLGENIGDLGGLAIAYKAYALSLEGNPAPVIDGLTGAQRFFFSWAECWRTKIRQEEAIRRLAIDPHAPSELRCNAVVRNLDAFYEAFDGAETDELWLPPEQRVSIW